jgi:hypothetical protein
MNKKLIDFFVMTMTTGGTSRLCSSAKSVPHEVTRAGRDQARGTSHDEVTRAGHDQARRTSHDEVTRAGHDQARRPSHDEAGRTGYVRK